MTLIHLVSQQTMQNLLPVLALKPATVVQIRSQSDQFHIAAERLKVAVKAAADSEFFRGLAPKFIEIVIEEPAPSAERSKSKVGETLSLWPDALVNITGGTKLMSIGAYLAAEYQREPILYCDTHARRFVPCGYHQKLPQMLSFDDVASHLDIETIMAAHGRGLAAWTSKTPSPDLVEFGREAAKIRAQGKPGEFTVVVRDLRKVFLDGRKYREKVAPLVADSDLKAAYFDAAARAGLLRRIGDGIAGPARAFQPASPTSAPAEYLPEPHTKKNNERVHKLLDGLWLELHVLDLMRGSHRFLDAKWSVEPAGANHDFGETDILCVDARKAGLVLISCKSIPPGLEHFEALRRRAELLGGSHTEAVLCIFECPPGDLKRIEQWAGTLNIILLVGDKIRDFFSTSPGLPHSKP